MKWINLKLVIAIILMIAESPATEIHQSEGPIISADYEISVEGRFNAAFEAIQSEKEDERIRTIGLCFLEHNLHQRMNFCDLELLLDQKALLADNLKKIAFEVLPNATEEEIRMGLGLVHLRVKMGITFYEVKNNRCMPHSLYKSRNRPRRNSAIF